MSSAYLVGHITVKDPVKWAECTSRVPATLGPWGSKRPNARAKPDGACLLQRERTEEALLLSPARRCVRQGGPGVLG